MTLFPIVNIQKPGTPPYVIKKKERIKSFGFEPFLPQIRMLSKKTIRPPFLYTDPFQLLALSCPRWVVHVMVRLYGLKDSKGKSGGCSDGSNECEMQ